MYNDVTCIMMYDVLRLHYGRGYIIQNGFRTLDSPLGEQPSTWYSTWYCTSRLATSHFLFERGHVCVARSAAHPPQPCASSEALLEHLGDALLIILGLHHPKGLPVLHDD